MDTRKPKVSRDVERLAVTAFKKAQSVTGKRLAGAELQTLVNEIRIKFGAKTVIAPAEIENHVFNYFQLHGKRQLTIFDELRLARHDWRNYYHVPAYYALLLAGIACAIFMTVGYVYSDESSRHIYIQAGAVALCALSVILFVVRRDMEKRDSQNDDT